MCHGYWERWERRFEEKREEPITFVSDSEEREPVEPIAEEPREEDREKVPAGVADCSPTSSRAPRPQAGRAPGL